MGETFEEPVGIITEDRDALFFFMGELPERAYTFQLVDPSGHVITSSSNIGGVSIQVKRVNNWFLFRVKFPPADINTDYVGNWKFRVRIDAPRQWADSLSRYNSPGMHRMSFAASVGSDYKLAASLAPGIVQIGEPIRMRAALTDGGWPSPSARVPVTIHRPDGNGDSGELYDDGAHGDDAVGDGIFGGTYNNTTSRGVYRFDFRSNGVTERGEAVIRQANRSQFVGEPADDPKESDCISCRFLRIIIWFGLIILLILLTLLWRIYRR